MARKLQLLLVAVLCTVLFTSLAVAQEEPKTKPSKDTPTLQDQLSLQRTCGSSHLKSGVTQKFGSRPDFLKEEGGSCYGWCDCAECDCWYYGGDIQCCYDGCGGCWQFLDDGGYCGMQ